MPNRAERRAAERAAHQSSATEPQPAASRDESSDHKRAAKLMGHLRLIADENPVEFLELATSIYAEYKPETPTELPPRRIHHPALLAHPARPYSAR